MTQENSGKSASATNKPDFPALRRAWQDLDVFFSKTACAPASAAAFSEKFGTFEDASGVLDFVANATIANQTAQTLGSAASLKQQLVSNPGLLQSGTAPSEIYAQVVWCASQVQNVATSFETTLGALALLLNPGNGSVEERAEQVKQILVGNLVPDAVGLKVFTMEFQQQITPLQAKLREVNEALNKSNLLNLANQEIGYLEAKLSKLNEKVAQAKKAADSALIGKEEKQKHYQELQAQANAMAAQIAAKRLFVSQMDNLFLATTTATVALLTVGNQIEKIGKIFADARSFLMSLCTSASAAQLADYQWLSGAMELPKGIANWAILANEAQKYTQLALTQSY